MNENKDRDRSLKDIDTQLAKVNKAMIELNRTIKKAADNMAVYLEKLILDGEKNGSEDSGVRSDEGGTEPVNHNGESDPH